MPTRPIRVERIAHQSNRFILVRAAHSTKRVTTFTNRGNPGLVTKPEFNSIRVHKETIGGTLHLRNEPSNRYSTRSVFFLKKKNYGSSYLFRLTPSLREVGGEGNRRRTPASFTVVFFLVFVYFFSAVMAAGANRDHRLIDDPPPPP